MPRVESCQEIEQVKNKLIEASVLMNVKNNPGFHPVCTNRCACRLLGIGTSNSTKPHMMGPKINFLDILLTANWLDDAGEY